MHLDQLKLSLENVQSLELYHRIPSTFDSALKALVCMSKNNPSFSSSPSVPHPAVSLWLLSVSLPVFSWSPGFPTVTVCLLSVFKPRDTLEDSLDPVPFPKHKPTFCGFTADEHSSELSLDHVSPHQDSFPISCTKVNCFSFPFEILFVFPPFVPCLSH